MKYFHNPIANRKLMFLIISSTLSIMAILALISYNKSKARNRQYINLIPRSKTYFTKSENLKYFYEPKPNSIEKSQEQVLFKWVPEATYTINPDGLNEHLNYSVNKPKDIYRIITLGDSFTFGIYMDTTDNWTELLENLLNKELDCGNYDKFEIINLGVRGYDIEYAVERFKIRGRKYNPDMLLWFLKNDDFSVIQDRIKPIIDKHTREMGLDRKSPEYFLKEGTPYPSWQKAFNEFNKIYEEQYILQYQKMALQKLSKYYDNKLIIFTFPSKEEKYKSIMREYANSSKNIYFTDKITNVYDLGEVFPDRHPTLKGHEIIAQDLFKYLNNERLISCI